MKNFMRNYFIFCSFISMYNRFITYSKYCYILKYPSAPDNQKAGYTSNPIPYLEYKYPGLNKEFSNVKSAPSSCNVMFKIFLSLNNFYLDYYSGGNKNHFWSMNTTYCTLFLESIKLVLSYNKPLDFQAIILLLFVGVLKYLRTGNKK